MVIEHIIAGYSIPHNEGAIPLTKEAYDISDPQKRLTDYSKTITIPENKTVNQIFEHAFDVNVEFQTFDPNLKTSYQIIQDGIIAIDGYCQLRSITNVDGLINYNIQATGKIGNLFEAIKDKYLQDLNLTSLDHVWSKANIEASWTAPIGSGYVYPMIDLGGRTNYSFWATQDFKPAIYLKQYLDAIFTEAGYEYASNFLNSDRFKSLIIPYGSGKILLDNAAILCREFNVGSGSNTTVQCQDISTVSNLANSTLIFGDDGGISFYTDRVIADGGVLENVACLEAAYGLDPNLYNTCQNEYNINTGIYTAIDSNKMSFQGSLKFDLTYTQSSGNTSNILDLQRFATFFNAYVYVYLIEKNGTTYSIKETFQLDITTAAQATPLFPYTSPVIIGENELAYGSGEISVVSGAEYFLSVGGIEYYSYNGGFTGATRITNYSDFDFTLKTDSTFASNLSETEIKVFDNIDTRLVIPKEIKQSDLLSSIIKRFNLYLEYDAVDENLIHIETRDDFLSSEKVNLEHLVDRSKSYDIKPLGALNANRFIFADKLDKDNYNDAYNKVNDEVYGQQIFDVQNDFLNADKTISTIFAPTPLNTIDGNNDRVLSAMQFVNENNQQVEATAKIRLLYWGGLLSTQKVWHLENPKASPTNIQTSYPYAGHLDNPYNPTFDLNWGLPRQLYYDFSYGNKFTLYYPNSNCYNIYWKKYIEEITDKNSRILECYLALRPYDYAELSFRKNYYIDGAYWRLLKVTDFDAVGEQTTKCEFLKVEPKDDFVGTIKPSQGGIGEYPNTEKIPTGDQMRRPNGNSGKQQNSLQFGSSIKGGTSSLIASDYIEQSLGSKNALVVGSDSSKVFADNVTIINSPYIEAVRPNEAYINGLFVEKLLSIELPNSVLTNLSTGLEVLPTLPANQFYQITRGYIRLNGTATDGGSHKVDFDTDTIGHTLAEIKASFFNTDDNVGYIDLAAHLTADVHFGEGIVITSNTDMSFDINTTLSISLIYRIITL
tara:strand:- start:3711 stop:6713 length:3003 start_codon:yes stop_codon:yes gene_type:complete